MTNPVKMPNNLAATAGWDSVPQWERDTPLLGGAGGQMNAQAQALANRVESMRYAISARERGVVGDGVADDYPKFMLALSDAKAKGWPLDISNLKLNFATQNAPIDLDGALIVGNGKLAKPGLDIAYINGADRAVAVWDSMRAAQGSGVFSRYNGPIFTGKNFNAKNFAIVCDYNKANSSAFVQSTPTDYPGWSMALKDTDVDIYYTGSHGIHLKGGLELCSLRRINVWFNGGQSVFIDMTAGINCPIEYFDIDATCSFIYGKQGNIRINGYRRNGRIVGCLLNGAGQYDVQLAANPSFTVASQTDIVAPIRVTALAPGVYGGVNHSGSDQLVVEHCYAEVAQGIVQTDGAPINSVECRHNFLIPWNNALPKNELSIQNPVYRLRTSGNQGIDGVFHLYIAPSVVSNAADYLIEEGTVTGGVSFVGAKPLDAALTPPPAWRQQSGTLGNGTAGTFTYDVAVNQQAAVNTAAVTAIWAISANFQDSQFDRNETVLMAVTRLSSGNYVGQVLVPPLTTQVFSAAPSVSSAGVLQIPLTLYSRARVARLDMQPLRIA